MRELTIGKNDAGQRLDKFLSKAVRTLPQSMMYRGIRQKKIKVCRHRAEPGQILHAGDTVEIFLPDAFLMQETPELAFLTVPPVLDILYEDADMLLVCKRPGMLVHTGDTASGETRDDTDTLVNRIRSYLYQRGEYDPHEEQSFVPALCNRIDRNTGGIVIAAKNAAALRRLNALIRDRDVTKQYLCAVHGTPSPREATLRGYIVKDEKKKQVTVSQTKSNDPRARTAVTHYRVVSEKNGLSLLKVTLLTGRTHQIRAQMAAAGHPLLGDGKYGVNRADRQKGYKYQALYAYRVELDGKVYTASPDKIWFLREFDPCDISLL